MYVLTGSISISWVGDGVGPLSVPGAQTLKVSIPTTQAGQIPVPGADAPTTGNISTACATFGVAAAALLNANIGQIQGFATGGN